MKFLHLKQSLFIRKSPGQNNLSLSGQALPVALNDGLVLICCNSLHRAEKNDRVIFLCIYPACCAYLANCQIFFIKDYLGYYKGFYYLGSYYETSFSFREIELTDKVM